MQGWMIALIVIAAVIFFSSVVLLLGSIIGVKAILKRAPAPAPGEPVKEPTLAKKYGVDFSWFETVKENTEIIEIESFDGYKLKAMLIRNPQSSGKVAICQHGYKASARAVQPHAQIFYDKGFDVILPYARAHGISEGKYIGMAWLDRFDVLRWLDKAIELFGTNCRIALIGVSMGGSTVAAVSGMNPPPQVKFIVDDCGFSSQFDEYASFVKKVPLPKKLCILPIAIGVKLVAGYSVYDADITKLVAKTDIPALFIHGDKDVFVPTELGKKLYDACASPNKKLVIVEGAEHAASISVDRQLYTDEVCAFVDKYI